MKRNSKNEKIRIGNDKLLSDIKSKSADEVTELAESIINTVREPLLILDKNLRVVKANRSFFDYFRVSPEETIGALIYDLGNRQWDIPELKELLEKILPEKTTFDNYVVEHDFAGIGNRILLLNARQIERVFGKEKIILLAIEDITKRKHLEESLSETSRMTSEYLDILVNHAHFPIIIWDASFVITRFNNSFEKLSGYDISEVMGKKIDFLFPENKRESTLKLLENSLHEEKFEIMEIDILRKDKGIRTVLWNSASVFDKDGRIIIATVAQDINELKRVEDALKESVEIFNHFMEKSPYYVFFKDKNIRALRLSANYEQMLGKPLTSILGKTMDELFPSELAKKMIEVDKEILNRRENVIVEEEFNGRYFTTIKFPIIINDIPQYLAGFTIDITEQKRAEAALRENEKFLKETQKIAHLGSYTLDVNTGIWKSSEILDSIFGIESDYDKSVEGWTSIIHPEWQRLMADYFANEVVGLRKSFDKEYKIVRKCDKTERWVHGLGELVVDKENKPIKMIGTIRDITELKNAEQEIVNLNRVYALLSNTNEAIVRIKDRQKLFDEICRIAIDNGKFRMAWIGIVNSDTNKVDVKASAGLIENYLEDINIDLNDEIRSGGPTGKAIKSGTNSITNDIENDKDMFPWKENALKLGYKSSATFPLNVFGKVFGVFSIYASQKDFFHQQEIRLLDEMAMDISFTLEFLETEKNQKVVEENLRISEERFRSLYENSTIGLYRTTPDGKILLANPTLVKLLGYSSFEELASRDLNKDGFEPDYDRRLFIERIDMDGEVKGFESAWTRNDGTIVYVLESAKAMRDSHGSTLYYDGVVEDITERKLAEGELHASKLIIEGIISSIPVGVFWKDKNLVFLGCNTIFANDAGFSNPREIIGKDDFQMVWREHAELYRDDDRNVIETGRSKLLIEEPHTTPEGKTITVLTSKIPLRNSKGEITGLLGTYIDITERKQAEEKIREKDIQFRKLSSQVPDLIFQFTRRPDGTYFVPIASEGIKNIFGCSPEDVLEDFTPIGRVIFPDDLTRVISDIEYSAKHLSLFTCEFRVQIPGKSIQWIHSKSAPEKLADGSITWYGFNTDITERKLAEKKLQESEERFRITAENLTDVIYDWDIKENIQWYGDIDGITGYPPGGFPRTLQAWAATVHPEDKDRVMAALEDHVKGVAAYAVEYRVRRKDGEWRWWSARGTALRNDRGEPYKMIGSITDISERKLSMDALHTSEAKFRSYVNDSPQGIFVVNAKGQYIDANNAALNQIGCSKEYLLQKTIADILPKEELEKGLNHFNILVKEGKSTSELGLLKTNGEKIYVILDTVKISDDHFLGFSTDITERKRAEEVLQQERDFSRTIIQTSPTFFVAIGSDGKTIMMNDSMLKTLGYTLSEVVGMDYMTNFIPVEDREKVSKIFEVLTTTNKPTVNENPILTKDGRKIIVEWHGKNILKPNGELNYFFGIGIDITERKQSEEALQKSEERFRSVSQSAHDAIITTDSKGIIIDWNKGAQEVFGYLETEISGKKLEIIIPKDNLAQHIKNRERSEQGEGQSVVGKAVELQGLHKNGKEFPIELSLAEWEIPSGKFFTGIIRDITERKRAEEEITMLAHSLKSINECVSITDLEDKILFVNKSFLKTYSYEENEVIGKQISMIRSLNNPTEFVKGILPATILGEWQGELLNKRKDGSEFPVHLSTTIINDKEGKPLGLIGVASDITERKIVESELIASKEKAEEMNRLKSNFLANMSHELRTPLVGILGFADILSQEAESQEAKAMADTIYKSGKRLSETLNLILDLSKFESEKWDIKHSKIDLVSKTEEVINSFEGTASKKGLTLKSSFSQNSIIINFEDSAFRSILNNLINNALKFTSEGSVTTTILLNNNFVEIKVIDTGIGIAEQDYQNIFEEFRQASEGYNRNFEGSGLGLSITKKLVEKFGGTITVESEIGKGSTFKVILPVINIEEQGKELTANVSKIIPELPEPKSVKPIALLVDDDPFVFTVLKRYASEYIELETTVDAEFAFKKLKKKQYDLIFMDINLRRGMDGKEATKKIRTMKGYESIPIIATTAYAMVGDKEEFLAAGCTHYLSKPFSQEEIVSLLEEVLKLI